MASRRVNDTGGDVHAVVQDADDIDGAVRLIAMEGMAGAELALAGADGGEEKKQPAAHLPVS